MKRMNVLMLATVAVATACTEAANGGSDAATSHAPFEMDSGERALADAGPTQDDGLIEAGTAADASAAGPDAKSILFEEDFETTPEDAVPAGFRSFVAYVVDANNRKDGAAYALVDGTKPHSGAGALHVKSDGQPAMITRALPEGTDKLFVRVWVYLTGSLGQAPGRNHETLLGVRKSVGAAHDELRFGEIKGVIGVNEVPSDNISPRMELWGGGPEISAGMWHCIEVAFRGDTSPHEVRAYRDGVEIFAVNDPAAWQNGPLSPTFLDGKFVELILGWHSFSNYANELWFDDLVAASARVGCD